MSQLNNWDISPPPLFSTGIKPLSGVLVRGYKFQCQIEVSPSF